MVNNTRESVQEKIESKKDSKKEDRQFFGIPYPSIYLHTIRLSCPFCNKRGRAKVHKNLWQLRMHFTSNHWASSSETQSCKNALGELVDYIKADQSLTERGVLR
jgi:hypothetical protein|tara:strand:+ start:921 stop:1232 length:312 start_codon:yes stop_codon:yes gene_type:complete